MFLAFDATYAHIPLFVMYVICVYVTYFISVVHNILRPGQNTLDRTFSNEIDMEFLAWAYFVLYGAEKITLKSHQTRSVAHHVSNDAFIIQFMCACVCVCVCVWCVCVWDVHIVNYIMFDTIYMIYWSTMSVHSIYYKPWNNHLYVILTVLTTQKRFVLVHVVPYE